MISVVRCVSVRDDIRFPARKRPSQRAECYSRGIGGSFLRRVISIRRRGRRCAPDSLPLEEGRGGERGLRKESRDLLPVSVPVRLPSAWVDLRERPVLREDAPRSIYCGGGRTAGTGSPHRDNSAAAEVPQRKGKGRGRACRSRGSRRGSPRSADS
jgi:hypothetical protein